MRRELPPSEQRPDAVVDTTIKLSSTPLSNSSSSDMGAGASTEKSAQERKSYGNLAGAVVSAKALRAALDGAGDDDVSLYALAQKATTIIKTIGTSV